MELNWEDILHIFKIEKIPLFGPQARLITLKHHSPVSENAKDFQRRVRIYMLDLEKIY